MVVFAPCFPQRVMKYLTKWASTANRANKVNTLDRLNTVNMVNTSKKFNTVNAANKSVQSIQSIHMKVTELQVDFRAFFSGLPKGSIVTHRKLKIRANLRPTKYAFLWFWSWFLFGFLLIFFWKFDLGSNNLFCWGPGLVMKQHKIKEYSRTYPKFI